MHTKYSRKHVGFSARNVAIALLATSVFSFFVSFVASGDLICSDARSCVAAVGMSSTYLSDPKAFTLAQTTPAVLPANELGFFPHGVQLTAFYGLLLSLIMLAIEKFRRPHSPKRILQTQPR